jgi:Domain of unknown function (DUF4326)
VTDGPKRIQRRRTKGWRMPEGAVYVGRPTKWGNPYRVVHGTVYGPARPIDGGDLLAYSTHAPAPYAIAAAVSYYLSDIDTPVRSRLTREQIRAELAGRDLCCWCPLDQPCHADVLLDLANAGNR